MQDKIENIKLNIRDYIKTIRFTQAKAKLLLDAYKVKQEAKIEAVKRALLRGKLTIQEIVEDNDLPLDIVRQIRNFIGS